jgi:uncharacterized membrane protein YedE/YeeE
VSVAVREPLKQPVCRQQTQQTIKGVGIRLAGGPQLANGDRIIADTLPGSIAAVILGVAGIVPAIMLLGVLAFAEPILAITRRASTPARRRRLRI